MTAAVVSAPARGRLVRWVVARFQGANIFSTLCIIAVIVMTALIAYPLISTFIRELFPNGQLDTAAFQRVFGSDVFWDAVKNSVIIVAISGGIALVLGCLIAWLNVRTNASIPFVSRLLPIVPLLMPGVAVCIGWVFLADPKVGYINVLIRNFMGLFGVDMGKSGPFDIATMPGMIFVYTIFLIPLPYLIMSAALQNLDRSLEEASRMSGAGLGRTLWRVSIPSVRFAIMSAILLIAVDGFSIFSVPAIIGVRAQINVLTRYTVDLIRQSYPPHIDDAVVISFFLVLVLGTLWYLNRQVQRSARHATIGGRTNTSVIRLGVWRPLARAVMVLYLLVTSALPLIAILIVSLQPFWTPQINVTRFSFNNYAQVFESPYLSGAFLDSFVLAAIGATVAIIIASLLAAYVRQLKGKAIGEWIDGVLKLPAATTHIVTGIAFLVVLGAAPFKLYGTTAILLLAYIAIYMPSASTSAMSANAQVGSDTNEASLMSGASSIRTFGRITLPLMRPGLAAGWALVFVAIVGDMTASSMLAGGPNPVVGFALLDLWNSGTFSQLAALASMITAISLACVGIMLTFGRGRGEEAK